MKDKKLDYSLLDVVNAAVKKEMAEAEIQEQRELELRVLFGEELN